MWLCIFVWYYYSAKRTYGGAWRQCFLTKIWRFYNTNCILVAIKTLSANDSWSGKLWILGGSLQFGSVRSQHSMMWPCIAHERRFFLDPNLGPRFEMAQIREFLSRSAWSAVQGIEANVDVDDVDVDVCRGQSMTEYDLHVRGCSSLLWHGSNLLHCPNQRWRPWSFQNSTIQVWVVSTDEDSNTASPDTFDGSSSIYIYIILYNHQPTIIFPPFMSYIPMISGIFDGEPKPHIYQKKALGASEFDSAHGGCQFLKETSKWALAVQKTNRWLWYGVIQSNIIGDDWLHLFLESNDLKPKVWSMGKSGKMDPQKAHFFHGTTLKKLNPKFGVDQVWSHLNHPMKRQLVENHI